MKPFWRKTQKGILILIYLSTKYKLTGKTIDNGYEFQVKQGKKTVIYEVHLAEKDLSVRKQGEKQSITYKAVDQTKLRAVQKDIHDRYEELMEDTENRFHDYVRNFIKKVTGAYGYLYTAEDGSYQLFLKVKRMYMQSEWAGSFLMRTVQTQHQLDFPLKWQAVQ